MMTGSEKIIARIREDGEERIAAIRGETESKVAEIKADGKKLASSETDKIISDAELKCNCMLAAADSSAELTIRNSVLSRRRKEIDKTLDMAVEYICNMSDSDYFDTLYDIALPFSGCEGEICFNSRDLERIPKDFESKLASAGLNVSVSREPVNIVGGFILKCGEIDYCADFKAVLEEKRDMLEDLVNRELFA